MLDHHLDTFLPSFGTPSYAVYDKFPCSTSRTVLTKGCKCGITRGTRKFRVPVDETLGSVRGIGDEDGVDVLEK